MIKIIKPLILWIIGGFLYLMCELLFRGYSHWSMFVVGGICFLCVGGINEIIPWETPIILQGAIGSFIITIIEFLSGCVLNLWLKWNVWDYSNQPCNLFGQICLLFSVIWIFLSLIAIVLDDYIRYFLFGEDKPRYTFF